MISAKEAAALHHKEYVSIEHIEEMIKRVANQRKYVYAGPISLETERKLKALGYTLSEPESDSTVRISW